MVALVAENMDHFDDTPALEFFEARAHVRARHAKRADDVIRVKRLGRDEEQGMHLRYRAVDAPPRPHFPPMQDELLLDGRERLHISVISVNTENTKNKGSVNKDSK